MNHTKISKILIVFFAVVLCFGLVGLAGTLGTGFTYQGRLIDANEAADGLYDFQFKLFDANSGGNKYGTDVNKPEVDVIDGYFTVELDFGSVFDGNDRWLAIGVRPGIQNDPCVYTFLSPRQKVTPTPYALYAKTASSGVSPWQVNGTSIYYNNGNVGIGETNPLCKLVVGQGGDILLKAAGEDAGDIIFSNSTGVQKGRIYTGLQNELYLTTRSDSVANVYIGTTGNVGIGTTSPSNKLDVIGSVKLTDTMLFGNSAGETNWLMRNDGSGMGPSWFGYFSGQNYDARISLTDYINPAPNAKSVLLVQGGNTDTDLIVDGRLGVYKDLIVGASGPTLFADATTGNVGIGTTSPGATLEVAGLVKITGGSPANGKVLTSDADGLASWQNPTGGGGADSDWTISGNNMYSGVSGNVGIGTTTPLAKLDVSNGTIRVIQSSPVGSGIIGQSNNAGDYVNFGGVFTAAGTMGRGVWGIANNSGDRTNYGGLFEADGSLGTGVYGIAPGLAGIGVKGSASNAGLYQNYGGYFEASGSWGRGVYGCARNGGNCTNFGGYFEAAGTNGFGVYGYAINYGNFTNYGGYFVSDGTYGCGVSGKANGTDGRGVEGTATSMDVNENYGGYFVAAGGSGSAGVYGAASNTGDYSNCGGYFVAYGSYGAGVYGSGLNHGGYFQAEGTYGWGVSGIAWGENGIGVYGRGGPSGYAAKFAGNVLICDRDTGATVMTLGKGLDYAEGFNVSEEDGIGPGTVLVIDRGNPGKLAVSRKAYDTKVAGIVAGAKGLTSGVRLGVEGFDCDVALAGRVYCNVDATQYSIEPGDILTTSDEAGYAMKAADPARASGAILGKAMEPLEKGKKGQILVLVTLQ